ncbi:rod shape-determining protein MreC [Geobacter pickeringii]|uniref:Cell shape-determining protein MreC n=1 Tax=Geobacter pickeringii TaxID=345632 RepID=A0A0B5BEC2_9BACT|nr:rod shape-determining protein MreC [Geobacter pickeringii]AJE04822.1 rod shape-determining protein MreC [Geobacter pickeringii]
MLELIKRYRFPIITGVALVVALAFYSLNLRDRDHANAFERTVMDIFAPVHNVGERIGAAVGGVWSDYVDLVDVRRENKQLRQSVKLLNVRILEGRETAQENSRLRALLDLKGTLRTSSVAAAVIGEDSSPWFKTLVINRGAVDGLQEGMPVVAASGVVGQVVKVASGSARVLLLTDHASGIAAVVQRSRARGVVKGKGGGLCSLEFSLREEDVKVGDTLVTSGMGGIFPKGLVIGEVSMVKKGEYGIFQTIDVKPAVNMAKLEEVLVLMQNGHD